MEVNFYVMYMNHLDKNMMNLLKKNIGREKPTKRSGPSVQGMVKTQLETLEVVKSSLFPHKCIQHFLLIVEYPRLI